MSSLVGGRDCVSDDTVGRRYSFLFIFVGCGFVFLVDALCESTNSLYRLKPVDGMIYSRTSQKVFDRECFEIANFHFILGKGCLDNRE